MYWKVSVGLKCVSTSRMDPFLHVSLSVSEILAVSFMVG